MPLPLTDPTYNQEAIYANPVWKLASWMSEVDNDNAPIGWGKYIHLAEWTLRTYALTEKEERT